MEHTFSNEVRIKDGKKRPSIHMIIESDDDSDMMSRLQTPTADSSRKLDPKA